MPPYIYISLCGGHSHLVPGNTMLWRVPSFPKYHQTSSTFYLHERQPVIIDTLSQCNLHNDLAMYWRFGTFQSQNNHAFIIDTLSQCNLHYELAVYCRYGTFQSRIIIKRRRSRLLIRHGLNKKKDLEDTILIKINHLASMMKALQQHVSCTILLLASERSPPFRVLYLP